MPSNRPPDDIDRLRDDVRDLARENAELRAMLARPAAARPPVEVADELTTTTVTGLPPTERDRRRRFTRRITFNLVLLAIGVVIAILSALRIDGAPVMGDGDAEPTPSAVEVTPP